MGSTRRKPTAESSDNTENTKCTLSRLREIERMASSARRQAAADCEEIGLVLERTTDLRYVVAAHTGASVEVCPNLTRHGEHLAGLLEWCGASPRIMCEAYDPPVRQRFSIVHELGHYHLHAHARSGTAPSRYDCTQFTIEPEAAYDDATDTTADTTAGAAATGDGAARELQHGGEHQGDRHLDAEAEADAFAAAFLVPAETLAADIAHFSRCIAFLAERYGVSEATMRKRLRTLERLRT